MKTQILLTLLVTAATLQGCKKDTDLLSAKDWIVGAWKPTLQGSDTDNDYTFDPEEKHTIADSALVTFQFKGGGVGYRIGPNHKYVDTLQWTLINNDKTLKLSINTGGFTQYLYYPFEMSYTSQTLLLIDTTVTPYFFKQYSREN